MRKLSIVMDSKKTSVTRQTEKITANNHYSMKNISFANGSKML